MLRHPLSLILGSAFLLLLVALVSYAVCLRACAKELTRSAVGIHSAADALQEIAKWRGRKLVDVIEEGSDAEWDLSYDVRLMSTVLPKLRIAPFAMEQMSITIRNGKLRYVFLNLYSGGGGDPPGVSVEEWFFPDKRNAVRVRGHDDIVGVEFSSAIPEAKRQKAFALNPNCFVKPWGCKKAEDILPGVWEMGSAPK